ncbi:sulfite exporter TauE/SafE family protein [Simkania negevensis]|uniref:Sulfite exporter TauE/SafE family protein n=1 Tax=Simkania negevensis TaxID=83561 RepID=A0ABS3APC8_9BACT|nr:sulfite exporter TauE/SafE family protein [Simkania negevensis]
MALFFSLLPIYLFGNLHCLGMCGPLVFLLGKHRYRYFYFLGRLASFSFAGAVAGGVGSVITLLFKTHNIPAYLSLALGGLIVVVGLCSLFGFSYPGHRWVGRRTARFNHYLSALMLKDHPLATLLFGFFTVALPCGQTLVVFSACALAGDTTVGLANGFLFALLTSPSLFFALQAHRWVAKWKKHYRPVLGLLALIVGGFALLRGFADLDIIPHLILNPNASPHYHIVMY